MQYLEEQMVHLQLFLRQNWWMIETLLHPRLLEQNWNLPLIKGQALMDRSVVPPPLADLRIRWEKYRPPL